MNILFDVFSSYVTLIYIVFTQFVNNIIPYRYQDGIFLQVFCMLLKLHSAKKLEYNDDTNYNMCIQ